jgi:magnesium-transporting ATPase (P-type)
MFRRVLYGVNVIDVKVKPYWQLLYEEVRLYSFLCFIQWHLALSNHVLSICQVLDPFYIFQWASVIFWFEDEYYYYAAAILFISFISMGISLYQTRKQLSDLRDMVATGSSVTAIRNNGIHLSYLCMFAGTKC